MGNQSRDRIAKLNLTDYPATDRRKEYARVVIEFTSVSRRKAIEIRPSTDIERGKRVTLTDDQSAMNQVLETLPPAPMIVFQSVWSAAFLKLRRTR